METSALNATNVEQAYTALVTNIYQKNKPKPMGDAISIGPPIDIPPPTKPVLERRSDDTITIKQNPNDNNNSNKPNGGCCKTG